MSDFPHQQVYLLHSPTYSEVHGYHIAVVKDINDSKRAISFNKEVHSLDSLEELREEYGEDLEIYWQGSEHDIENYEFNVAPSSHNEEQIAYLERTEEKQADRPRFLGLF